MSLASVAGSGGEVQMVVTTPARYRELRRWPTARPRCTMVVARSGPRTWPAALHCRRWFERDGEEGTRRPFEREREGTARLAAHHGKWMGVATMLG